MAIQKLKPAKPVAYEPVMIAVSKARAMASVLEQLGDTNNSLVNARRTAATPRRRVNGSMPSSRRRSARRSTRSSASTGSSGRNLLQKELAQDLTPKDGA